MFILTLEWPHPFGMKKNPKHFQHILFLVHVTKKTKSSPTLDWRLSIGCWSVERQRWLWKWICTNMVPSYLLEQCWPRHITATRFVGHLWVYSVVWLLEMTIRLDQQAETTWILGDLACLSKLMAHWNRGWDLTKGNYLFVWSIIVCVTSQIWWHEWTLDSYCPLISGEIIFFSRGRMWRSCGFYYSTGSSELYLLFALNYH